MEEKKGFFIAIEGTDGSGKRTQANLLVSALENSGRKTQLISFPRYNEESGRGVKAFLEGSFGDPLRLNPYQSSILYAFDRVTWFDQEKIQKKLDEGVVVVADRYVASNLAHQGVKLKDEEKRGEFFSWIEDLEFNKLQIPRPDIAIILFVPVEVSLRLLDQRKLTGENPDNDKHKNEKSNLEEAQKIYFDLAQKDKYCLINCAPKATLSI